MLDFELLPADLEDRIRIQAIEAPQADQLVVALPTKVPLVDAVMKRPSDPIEMLDDRRFGKLRTGPHACLQRFRQVERFCRFDDLLEEGGKVPARRDLALLPEPDLWPDGPRSMLFEVSRDGLHARRHRLEPDNRGIEVAGEEREERVTDGVDPRRMTLPSANDVDVEDFATEIVDLEVPIEPHGRAHRRGIETFDQGQVAPISLQLTQYLVPGGIRQLIVECVDAVVGRRHRIGLHHAPEAGLDEIVEWRIGRTAVGRRRRTGQGNTGEGVSHRQFTRCAAGRATRPELVSASAARMISTVRPMSEAEIPRWVAARIC